MLGQGKRRELETEEKFAVCGPFRGLLLAVSNFAYQPHSIWYYSALTHAASIITETMDTIAASFLIAGNKTEKTQ